MLFAAPTILMCPPDYYGIEYEINPWMSRQRQSDPAAARDQWRTLKALLEQCGAKVELLPPQPGLPDMVFTANAAFIYRNDAYGVGFREVSVAEYSGQLINPEVTYGTPDAEADAAELEAKGVELATTAPGGELADPKYRPLLRRVQELKLTLFAHPNTIGTGGRLDCYYLTNLIGNPLETTIMVANLMFSGALEELSRLKILLAHGGGFVPYQIGRFVRGHKVRPETRANTAASAKELLKRFHFDTITHDPQALRYLVELVGAERILLGTDSPFDMGDETPRATLSRFSPEEVATLRKNALRLLEE